MKIATVLRFAALVGMIVSTFVLHRAAPEQPQEQQQRAIDVIVSELRSGHGPSPVAVKCQPVFLTNANQLQSLTCTLRNITVKNITAVCLTYTIVIENMDGETVRDTHSWALDTSLHPDFQMIQKPIAPGTEAAMNTAAISFEASTPKMIEIAIDYVEFENGSTAGPNVGGSQVISDMRHGANLYKEWLAHAHVKNGKSIPALRRLIEAEDPALPDELRKLNFNPSQEQGAKAYKTLINRLWEKAGADEVLKHFPK